MPVSKKQVTKKSVSAVIEEPITVVPEQQPVVEETPVEESVPELPVETAESKMKKVLETVEIQYKEMKKIRDTLRETMAMYSKEMKALKSKKQKTPRDKTKEYVPHGFTKPVPISPELAEFLGVGKDELIARPYVTKVVAKYVRDNGLADPKDGSIFKADKKLLKVLGEPKFLVKPKKPELGLGYSFGTLQKHLVPHFTKKQA